MANGSATAVHQESMKTAWLFASLYRCCPSRQNKAITSTRHSAGLTVPRRPAMAIAELGRLDGLRKRLVNKRYNTTFRMPLQLIRNLQ